MPGLPHLAARVLSGCYGEKDLLKMALGSRMYARGQDFKFSRGEERVLYPPKVMAPKEWHRPIVGGVTGHNRDLPESMLAAEGANSLDDVSTDALAPLLGWNTQVGEPEAVGPLWIEAGNRNPDRGVTAVPEMCSESDVAVVVPDEGRFA